MVVLSLEEMCQILHHSLSKLLLSTTLLAGVHLQGMIIAIAAICKYPHLYWQCSVFGVCVGGYVCVCGWVCVCVLW